MEASKTQPRTFTWEELSRLNQPGSVHVAHKGKVITVPIVLAKKERPFNDA